MCCFWETLPLPSRSSSSLPPKWSVALKHPSSCGYLFVALMTSTCIAEAALVISHQAPISVYTSGKGSSAAGLTATVVQVNLQ